MTDQALEPRIYVASLSDYNAGRLHGTWINASYGADEIREEIRKSRPQFVGTYAITATINTALELGRLVKEEVPEATFILGGVHPTNRLIASYRRGFTPAFRAASAT